MKSGERWVAWGCVACLSLLLPGIAQARQFTVNVRSAIVVNMTNGDELFEQNADALIPPASITKVLSLYLVFEAMRQGQVHQWDKVLISKRAAAAPPSKMGLKAGEWIPLEDLIKGMAVISGNDASIAVAEHVGGSVENFVRLMNIKARQLGMNSSTFMTPNGLPAKGQLTTARDISKLSIAYLRRFPESLAFHSMQSYTYNNRVRRNPNRLLGRCPGVDGLKTGFVCASGFNLSATAKRDDVRLLAVVLGAQSPGVRAAETTRLLEMGFRRVGVVTPEIREVRVEKDQDEEGQCSVVKKYRIKGTARKASKSSVTARSARHSSGRSTSKAIASGSRASRGKASAPRTARAQGDSSAKAATVGKRGSSTKVAGGRIKGRPKSTSRAGTAEKPGPAASARVATAKSVKGKTGAAEHPAHPASTKKGSRTAKVAKSSGKNTVSTKDSQAPVSRKQTAPSRKQTVSSKAKQATQPPAKKSSVSRKSDSQVQQPKGNKG